MISVNKEQEFITGVSPDATQVTCLHNITNHCFSIYENIRTLSILSTILAFLIKDFLLHYKMFNRSQRQEKKNLVYLDQ